MTIVIYLAFLALKQEYTSMVLKHASTNIHRTSTTVKMTLSDLPSTDTGFNKHHTLYSCQKVNISTFIVAKHACITSTGVKMALSDLPSTETGVYEHPRTSTDVKI